MGFEFKSANKGCEALSYSFVDFLSQLEMKERLKIYVYSSNVGLIPEYYPNIDFIYIKPGFRDIKCRWIRSLVKCDYVFDVTMGDSFSDIYSKSYCSMLLKEKKRVEFFNRKYVLLPQTYGPFKDDIIKKDAVKIINNAYKVFSRDAASVDYLQSLNVKKKVFEQIDLAFMLPFDKNIYSISTEKKNLGINISGLLWRGGFDGNNQFGLSLDYKEYALSIIKHFASSSEWKVHLIAHVIDRNENSHDDDYLTLSSLHDEFPNTILAPPFKTPIEAKSFIANMDCFIGSRMHSTIAAISSGVPVIPVSYSRKFEGLFDSLNYQYLIHGNEDKTEEAIQRTIEYVDGYEEINKSLLKIKPEIDSKVIELKNRIQSILKELQ